MPDREPLESSAPASSLLSPVEVWIEGTRYTHEHFTRMDDGKFVGHIPAPRFRSAETPVLALLEHLIELAHDWRYSDEFLGNVLRTHLGRGSERERAVPAGAHDATTSDEANTQALKEEEDA